MKDLMKLLFLLMMVLSIITGCSDNFEDPAGTEDEVEEEETSTQAPELTQDINQFIFDAMDLYYLWNAYMPDIDIKYETDSEEYFEKLLYEDDRWSFVTDDVVALENSFEGIEKSYGWSLAFGRFSNTGNIFAIVEFVYPNTPAEEQGVKRGDIIIEMNSADITDDNYLDLLGGENISITFGLLTDDGITTGSSVSLVARDLTLNPVLKTAVVEQNEHKIGYIFYAQYIYDFNFALDTALQSMIDQQVTDLVLDLRYNPGGGITAAQHLCSSIAPLSVVNDNSKLVSYRWNEDLQEYWEANNQMDQLQVEFDSQVDVKMGLNKIHILTGTGTASASELTITGLKPYMTVTTVGETTHGKYTASITLSPENVYTSSSYYEDFKDWAIQPIVLRYANSEGVTDFAEGFTPDIAVEDDLFATAPLGDPFDPLFAAAIEDITGETIVAIKSAEKIDIPYSIIDRGFSKFDQNKRELLIDNIDLDLKK